MPELPVGIVTFLFTDIEGSTPLWERDPTGMKASLAQHNDLLNRVISSRGGQVFKVVGDSFQAAFAVPHDAVMAAILAQRALASVAWDSTGPLRVRMGLHTGLVAAAGNDYAPNHTLNRAARVMSAAHGGQILLSQPVADLVRGHLPAEVRLLDLGEHQMKGLSHPEHLFQATAPDLESEFPPLRSEDPFRSRYRIGDLLGKGGMGSVYRAHDTLLDRDVAIKLLNNPGLGNEARIRLLREAQAAARLSHPNIVTVFDAGEWDGVPLIVMELVEGAALSPSENRPIAETLSIARQICAALVHAHEHHIIHRDLKPENVVITEAGKAKLMDFGLALSSLASRLTVEGTIMGTAYYLAPEQALGQDVDGRADLYSLGVLLYELITNRLPFSADDPLSVISQHIHAPVVPPRAYNDAISPDLDALIVRLLNKRPEDRPSTAKEVLQALESLDSIGAEFQATGDLTLLDRIVRGRLIGREREMAEANAYWQRAISGNGQVLFVSGEPGIGKTRFASELVTLAGFSGGKTLWGECYAEGGAPYAPVAQIIRSVLGDKFQMPLPQGVMADLLTLAPDLQRQYPDIPPNPQLDPEFEQQRLYESMVEFCQALTQQGPLLIVFDDAHWADSGTLFLVRYLARRLRGQPVMIILTYREVELDEARPLHEVILDLNRERLAARLKLSRLSKEETRHLLSTMFAEEITPEFLDGIFFETEGNPFFIEEVCKALIESGKLFFAEGRWHRPSIEELEIPQSVRLAIQARLAKLPAICQELLTLAAVMGREFEFDALAKAAESDEDTLISALERIERAQLIQEVRSRQGELVYYFSHALIPATLYESASAPRRRRLHRKIGEAFESLHRENFEALAHHFSIAGQRRKAIDYSQRAALRAVSLFAYEVAFQHLSAALQLSEPDEHEETQLSLLEDIGDVLCMLGRKGEAIPMYQEAVEVWNSLSSPNKMVAIRLHRKIGEAVVNMTWFEDRQHFASISQTALGSGLELAENEPPHPEIVRLLSTLSSHAWNVQFPIDWDAAESFARAAVERADQLGQPAEQSAALGALASAYGGRGLFRERVEVSLRRLQLSRDPRFQNPLERASILLETGKALVYVGEYQQAADYLKEAESLSGEIQAIHYQVMAMRYHAQSLFRLDRWDGVIEIEEKLRALEHRFANFLERSGPVCFFLALIASVYALRGEPDRATPLREESKRIMTASDGPPNIWGRDNHY